MFVSNVVLVYWHNEPSLTHSFFSVSPLYEPNETTKDSSVHVSKSYDASSHFMTIGEDIVRLYKEVTGESDVSYILVPKEDQ